ncbi:MAG TPA: dipeptide epimerase [Polyangiaceae bacterium]|nr:dipeptide epimerase [Polyangiaceae bacterium]
MTPTTITSVAASRLDLPLTEPFAIATGAPSAAANVLVQVDLADGTVGLGEAAPFAEVSGETQASCLRGIEAARAWLVGRDARGYRPLSAELGEQLGQEAAARCALEVAIFDALARHWHVPLWAFFGGHGATIHTDMTITAGSAEHAARAAAAILDRGISTIKVKVGALSAEEDAQRLAAVRRVAPEAPLIVDANGGYTPEQAVELIERLDARSISLELFEQPVAPARWAEFRGLTARGRVPICADESARSAADVLRLIRDDAIEAVNIKPMKCGVVEAMTIWNLARTAGKRIMIGGMVESSLSMSFSVHLAAGLGGFSYADLDTPMFMQTEPFVGGFRQQGSELSVAHVEAGHGAVVR